jgi:hypothetical protein
MKRIDNVRINMKAHALVALSFIALSTNAVAQSPAVNKQTATARPKSPVVAYDPLAESRRTTAVSLVSALADEARSFHDEMLRARVQARAADALWETDQERARSLFRRAWDAADLADKEIARKLEEDKRRQLATGNSVVLSRPANLRSEVLRLAAKRDRALGEEFLAHLDDQRKQEERDAAAARLAGTPQPDKPAPNTPAGLTIEDNHRLELARQLLQGGDAERALQFAEPALQTVTRDSVFFLSDLREKTPDAADRIFSTLLARAAVDPSSDANTISTLSSYVLTPHLVITITPDGGFSTESNGHSTPPENFPAALRVGFMQAAAQVLLRPPAPADQDHTTGGRASTYFVIARLLPLFEQYLPAATPALRAQLTALTPDIPKDLLDNNDRWLTEGLKPADATRRDDLQDTLDRLNNAKTDEERDDLYTGAAMLAASRRDPRARDYAANVKDTDAREQLLPYVDYTFVTAAVEKKDVPEILRIARNGAMTHLQNVWALTEASRLSLKENRPLASDLLEEALQEVRRVGESDADRPRALLAVITPLYELDPSRVWSLLPDLVKAVNAASDFTGEDGRLVVKFRTKRRSSIHSSSVDRFNLQPLFQLLARADMNRAVEIAKSFTNESPRASATLAVASAVLSDAATKADATKPKAKL